MVDDDEFDGLGAATCTGCGQAVAVLRVRRRMFATCDDCGIRYDLGDARGSAAPARRAARPAPVAPQPFRPTLRFPLHHRHA